MFYLNFSVGILLNSDPQKSSYVIEKSLSAGTAALKEFEGHIDENQLPGKGKRKKRVSDLIIHVKRSQSIH